MKTGARSPRPDAPGSASRAGPGRGKKSELEARRHRILDAAFERFTSQGISATSTAEIASDAGVSARTVQTLFGNEVALFCAVIQRLGTSPELRQPELDLQGSLFDALLSIGRWIVTLNFHPLVLPAQRMLITESVDDTARTQLIFEVLESSLCRSVEAQLAMLANAGRVPPGDQTESARWLIDLLVGVRPLQLAMGWSGSTPTDKEVQAKVAAFVAGRYGQSVPSASPRSSHPARIVRRAGSRTAQAARTSGTSGRRGER